MVFYFIRFKISSQCYVCMTIQTEFPLRRKSKPKAFLDETQDEESIAEHSFESEEQCAFEHNIFYVIDSVILVAGIRKRCIAARMIHDLFYFLCGNIWLLFEIENDLYFIHYVFILSILLRYIIIRKIYLRK